MDKPRGLCLASTAIQKGDLSALASQTDTSGSPKTSPGLPTRAPFLPRRGLRKKRDDRPRTFYLSLDSSSERSMFRWKRTVEGKPSLSGEPGCLSLHVYSSTNVLYRQEDAPAGGGNPSHVSRARGLLATCKVEWQGMRFVWQHRNKTAKRRKCVLIKA
jgi:hypothetical protein